MLLFHCRCDSSRTSLFAALVLLSSLLRYAGWGGKGGGGRGGAMLPRAQRQCVHRKTYTATDFPTFELLPSVHQRWVCLLVACLTSQQQASVSQGRICSDNCTCCHTEIEVADQTFYLTQSQYSDTGPTSPSADPITPGAWQGSHWSANFGVTGMT